MMSVLLFYHHNDVISCKQEQENRIETNLEDKEKQTYQQIFKPKFNPIYLNKFQKYCFIFNNFFINNWNDI